MASRMAWKVFSSGGFCAKYAPEKAPPELPPMISRGIPPSSIACMIPPCMAALKPPPLRAIPIAFPEIKRANFWKSARLSSTRWWWRVRGREAVHIEVAFGSWFLLGWMRTNSILAWFFCIKLLSNCSSSGPMVSDCPALPTRMTLSTLLAHPCVHASHFPSLI